MGGVDGDLYGMEALSGVWVVWEFWLAACREIAEETRPDKVRLWGIDTRPLSRKFGKTSRYQQLHKNCVLNL